MRQVAQLDTQRFCAHRARPQPKLRIVDDMAVRMLRWRVVLEAILSCECVRNRLIFVENRQ
jgi:hypothetical protein